MMATGFAQNGADVYIAARKEKPLQEVRSPHFLLSRDTELLYDDGFLQAVADIKKVATGRVAYIVADISVRVFCFPACAFSLTNFHQSKAGCDALIQEFRKRESKLHVLINNSGAVWGAPYNDFPEERGWDNIFNVNVKSIFYSE